MFLPQVKLILQASGYIEQLLHILEAFHLAGAEADAVGTAVEGVDGEGVGFGQGVGGDVLTDVPDIVVSMFAAGEGCLAGVAVEILDVFQVFGTIIGLHLKTFDGLPDKFFLVVGTFEVFVDDFFPFLG